MSPGASYTARDTALLLVLLGLWLSSDVIVLLYETGIVDGAADKPAIEHKAPGFMEYLTNWVWAFGVATRVCLLVTTALCGDVAQCASLPTAKGAPQGRQSGNVLEAHRVHRWAVFAFLVYGSCIFGVMVTFFVLLLQDESMLVDLQNSNKQKYTLARIIFWNHFRHVLVVILHTLVLLPLVRIPVVYKGYTLAYGASLLCLPFAIGSAHNLIVNWIGNSEAELYSIGSVDVEWNCRLAYALSTVLTGVYYMIAVILEEQEPT